MRKLAKRRRISGRRFSPCEEKRRPEIRRSRANGTEEAKNKKRKPGMQSTGGWDIPDAPPPPKKVLYVLPRFFCPVGDKRSLSVILFSDW